MFSIGIWECVYDSVGNASLWNLTLCLTSDNSPIATDAEALAGPSSSAVAHLLGGLLRSRDISVDEAIKGVNSLVEDIVNNAANRTQAMVCQDRLT